MCTSEVTEAIGETDKKRLLEKWQELSQPDPNYNVNLLLEPANYALKL